MKIVMLVTAATAENCYSCGGIYNVDDKTGRSFIKHGQAREHIEIERANITTQEIADVNIITIKKEIPKQVKKVVKKQVGKKATNVKTKT